MELQAIQIPLKNKRLQKATSDIRKLELASNRNLFKIASILKAVEENNLYMDDGFKNTTEYGHEVLGYKKTSVSTMIRVAQRFIDDQTGETVFPHSPGNDYSMFQLTELLTLSDESIGDLIASGELHQGINQKNLRAMVKQERIRIGELVPKQETKEPTHISVSDVEAHNLAEAPEQVAVAKKAIDEMDGKKMSDIARQLSNNLEEYPTELIKKVLYELAEFLQAKGF